MNTSPIELVLRPHVWEALPVVDAMPKAERPAAIASLGIEGGERAALLTQLDLREQAESKFGEFAHSMIFTRDGLEQATRLPVAALHARRFASAGVGAVADLGCGVGSDSMAFAATDINVDAWDINPEAVACAKINLRFHPNAKVHIGDVSKLDIRDLVASGIQGIFADPARRTGERGGSRRISSPSEWSPSLPQVLSWREALREGGFDALGIKVAPGIDYEHIPSDFEAQWVSDDRQLVEASLWSPALREAPGRSAAIFRGGSLFHMFEEGDPTAPAEQLAPVELSKYLWEPDPAIIRAGLIAKLVRETSLEGPISPNIAYLTSTETIDGAYNNAVTGFEVLDVTNLRPKAISKALRALKPTSIEVKKRGTDIDPAALQTALKKILVPKTLEYSRPLTVFATRVGGAHRAIIARRLTY
ncbi:MAG: class I SAM-dependent methyltransferase [Actinomycetaceae bacterium]|nr:class I SAM-dependent methyltransferase [Actinomycetaceae bacterium]